MLLLGGAIIAALIFGALHAKAHVPTMKRAPRAGAILLGFAGALAVLLLQPSAQLSLSTLVTYAVCFLLASIVATGVLWHQLLPDSGRTLVQTIGRSFLHPPAMVDEWMLWPESEVDSATATENTERQ
ncbi:hypothetical protein [Salinibacterium sp. M195]|uniref:hypothetical protein n=1 Tax=Salinibacterium sp. M195 TaxID=2583374 RepID=UPI001C625BE9|nr:hypothetical protein [Salinibacterium sp. M195]QYH34789.1 hypothetical protein FFT87_01845 [Salinibacterium sp. M195]